MLVQGVWGLFGGWRVVLVSLWGGEPVVAAQLFVVLVLCAAVSVGVLIISNGGVVSEGIA